MIRALKHEEWLVRALIQRVSAASVAVEGQTIGQIDAGLLVLVFDWQRQINCRYHLLK